MPLLRLPSLQFKSFAISVRFPGSASFNCLRPGGAGDGDRDFEPRLAAEQLALVVRGRGQIHEHAIGDSLGAGVSVNEFAPEVVVLALHGMRLSNQKRLPVTHIRQPEGYDWAGATGHEGEVNRGRS
jgi:hypothetical protein